jgi:hypothetical protein
MIRWAGFEIREARKKPNTIVRTCGRAKALYSPSYSKTRFRFFGGTISVQDEDEVKV